MMYACEAEWGNVGWGDTLGSCRESRGTGWHWGGRRYIHKRLAGVGGKGGGVCGVDVRVLGIVRESGTDALWASVCGGA